MKRNHLPGDERTGVVRMVRVNRSTVKVPKAKTSTECLAASNLRFAERLGLPGVTRMEVRPLRKMGVMGLSCSYFLHFRNQDGADYEDRQVYTCYFTGDEEMARVCARGEMALFGLDEHRNTKRRSMEVM